ncbi:MAG TPA: cardiolipin synthase [Mediterranea massiliensis]|uniref:Cardiolipin synthase n=1 Tax=Mediterranea massiliensis TaxID=1841865 RepID=A0A921HXZ7_9BACT|nr:cardiolipin synthase [Mediterranea massiliensis]HJF92743.1 cardiolipin synthase [Mediterranea massiliensis]
MQRLKDMGIPVTYNNRVELLMNGHDKFVDLFEAIRGARHHVHLEYFNFRNDSIANALFDLLAQKAAEGVKVRALFDAFGNWSNNQPLKKKHLEDIRRRGIEIVKFDPITFPWFNHAAHRDHRKIVVIDGKIGYTGGMNIADYYIKGLPKIGEWHDIHVRIDGDAVRYLQGIFLTMWNRETGQHVGGPEYFPDTPQLPDSIAEEIMIVDRTPRETPRSISRAYAASIRSADSLIRIVNPYFVPTKSIQEALKHALKKGTEVEIMVPSVSDVPFTPEAAFYILHKLMKRGAKVYLFNGGFHHSKVMMVDGSFCTVGTANLNSRSLRYDYETNAFIFDPETTAELTGMFEHDKGRSTLLTPEVWKERSAWKKFVGWFAHLLTPFL